MESVYKDGDIESAFKLAAKNVISFGDTDIFPYPVETRMFSDIFDSLSKSLFETHNDFINRLNESAPVNISTCSTVGYTGYRWATQIDPYWNLITTETQPALIISLASVVILHHI
ncbi:hypothetical protein [Photobacterium toruni]|uniref:hypothetical protein n=1 Tax=Photobacterium toruni TaxID=1935446 RepID=UPI002110DE7A|nr:hypothetical protein [Photobacterium toruni]